MDTLKLNSTGPQVQLLQKALIRAGTLGGGADGFFGPDTQRALEEFQAGNGLAADGIAGPETWAALRYPLANIHRHTVRSGDTLSAIALSNGIPLAELMSANPGVVPERLMPGMIVLVPMPGSIIDGDIYYSSVVMEANIDALLMRYPFLGRGAVGRSLLESDISLLRFGRGQTQVLYNASHHANEYITTPILLRFIETLCAAAVNNARVYGVSACELYESMSLFAVPMVNPDGVDLVTGELRPGSEGYEEAYAIRGDRAPFPSGWKANIRGVDLNNNYPALFEEGVREKEELGINYPGPRDYTGPYALSEPESRAMARLTRALNAQLTISMHTQGREIYWRFNDITPPDGLRIGNAMVESSPMYRLADPPGPSFGGYKDWFIQEYILPGYTLEIGVGINPLPVSEFDALYAESEPILAVGMLELIGGCPGAAAF